MCINIARLRALLLGLAVGLGCLPAQAGQQVLLFDTPASGFAEVESIYGLAKDGGVADARVVDGQLRLYGTGGVNANLVFAATTGDLRFQFLADIGGPAGYVNVGFTTGNQVFYIHPGYWDQYFLPGLGVTGSLGFTPNLSLPTHFSVDITAATGLVSVIVQNGQQLFGTSFIDTAYIPGVSRPGLTIGSVPGYYAAYDELVINTVPEPSTWALWGLGVLVLAFGRPGWRRSPGRRAAWIAAAGATALMPATASVLLLHDEAVDGDLSNQGYSLAADQRQFTLTAGISRVSGEVVNAYIYSGNWAASRDVDAFQLVVPVGLRVTGVDLRYALGGSGFGAPSYAQNFWRTDMTQPGAMAEYIAFPRSGSEALFDAGSPFQPVDGTGQAGLFWLQLQDDGGVAGTRYGYAYTLDFHVEALPATVPEPGTGGLVFAGLAVAACLGRRWPAAPVSAPTIGP